MPYMRGDLARLKIATVFNQERRNGVRKLAEVTGIPYGALRNAVYGHDVMALDRIVLVETALGLPEGSLVADAGDGTPDTPPDQPPNKPTAPPRRSNGEDDRRGPSTTRRTRPGNEVGVA